MRRLVSMGLNKRLQPMAGFRRSFVLGALGPPVLSRVLKPFKSCVGNGYSSCAL